MFPSSTNSLAMYTHPIHCTVHFGNDQFALILGYGDLNQGNITIKRVYYVEGLNHNLFSVASKNGKKYILVIVDDYSRYTWTLFLRSKMLYRSLKELSHDDSTQSQAQVISVLYLTEHRVLEQRHSCLFQRIRLKQLLYSEQINHHIDLEQIINDRKPSIKHLHIFGCICYITKDGENLDKMKEKGIHVSWWDILLIRRFRVYNQENTLNSLVPQGQKASDYDNSNPVPPRQNVVPIAEKTDSSHQGLEFLFSPLIEEYYTPTHGQAEENNNDQAPNASFQEAEFINPFCTRVQEIGEPSSRNIDNTDVHSFQLQSRDYRWTRDHPLEQVRRNPTMPVQIR
ncbi:integrase, catalytic region, zinc finger, CCHC-type containing protein [Tanacetum coccineum]